jgi:hypothetical protein
MITFLMKVFSGVLPRQYFLPIWKHAREVSMPKMKMDRTCSFSYSPIRLLDTVGNLFERILLTWVLREMNQCGLLLDEQFGLCPELALHCSWPVLLKESTETLTRGG